MEREALVTSQPVCRQASLLKENERTPERGDSGPAIGGLVVSVSMLRP